MKVRVSHLHRTEAEWLKLASWKPEAGELIVYDPDENYDYARIKIGDGINSLQKLAFIIDKAAFVVVRDFQSTDIIDSGRITEY